MHGIEQTESGTTRQTLKNICPLTPQTGGEFMKISSRLSRAF